MEFLHNLWNIVNTEDKNLIQHISIFLAFIENYVYMNFFITIFNINCTKKQKITYILVMEVLSVLSAFFIPNEYSIFVSLILTFVIIKIIFKLSYLKSILSEIIIMLTNVVLETCYTQLYFLIFGKSLIDYQYVVIYRISIMLINYFNIFLLTLLVKRIRNKIPTFKQYNSSKIRLLVANLMFLILLIGLQFYLFIFYKNVLPLHIYLISLISLITYSFLSIFSIIKTIDLDVTQKYLEQSELHNKSLSLLYNNVSAFKHDFSNIITAFGGYIYSKNIDGLETYYNKIIAECHINNNLSTLNPEIINNPAIYNILATKYYKADELGITINLQIFINLNTLKLNVYEFCRILGILLDNAIEASSDCSEKIINIELTDIKPRKYQLLKIENTYSDKNIDLSKLSERNYTSKTKDKESHGIGLWQISKMLKKHKDIILETSTDDKFFKQELIIYYK